MWINGRENATIGASASEARMEVVIEKREGSKTSLAVRTGGHGGYDEEALLFKFYSI
jgi:hypothetical protein